MDNQEINKPVYLFIILRFDRPKKKTMSFIKAPLKDTRPYHPNAPKRSASVNLESDRMLPASRLKYEGNKEYDEARKAFSSQRGITVSEKVQEFGRTGNRSPSQPGNKIDSQLFPSSAFPDIGGEPLSDDDLPNPPSLDGSSNSLPLFIASRGEAAPADVVVGTTPGGYVLDAESKFLTVATKVVENDQGDGIYGPYAYLYEGRDQNALALSNKRIHWFIIAGCCIVMLGGVLAIVLALVIQSTKGPGSDAPQMDIAPSFSPSTSAEADFMKGMSAIVGDGVFKENSYLERAANWMMNVDAMALGPFDPTFLQRFLLAVFYFSTTDSMSPSWQSCGAPAADETSDCLFGILVRREDDSLDYDYQQSVRWLSDESECVWAGVTCSEGRVNTITLGKCAML